MDYKLKGDKFNLEAVWAKLRMASVLNNSYLLGIKGIVELFDTKLETIFVNNHLSDSSYSIMNLKGNKNVYPSLYLKLSAYNNAAYGTRIERVEVYLNGAVESYIDFDCIGSKKEALYIMSGGSGVSSSGFRYADHNDSIIYFFPLSGDVTEVDVILKLKEGNTKIGISFDGNNYMYLPKKYVSGIIKLKIKDKTNLMIDEGNHYYSH